MFAKAIEREANDVAMVFNPANRLKSIKPSGIRKYFELARGKSGIINLSVGEPDFSPPTEAIKVGFEAALHGETHYAATNGLAMLREALATKAFEDYGLNYNPNEEILVTAGATEAIFIALTAMINPGEEVLVPNPGFVVYEPCVRLAGGVPVAMPLYEKNGFRPLPDDVTSLVTSKSRVMILNFPSNPTGSILSMDEVEALAEIAVRRDIIVICDEVYEKMIYDGEKYNCPTVLSGMRERTIVVNSFSKTYAMTGLRVGYLYGCKELISPLWLVHQYTVACVDILAQHIALAALTGHKDFVRNMVNEFDRRRKMVCDRLSEIEGFHCHEPKGAFYVFPNIEAFGMPSERFSEFLVCEAGVVTVPGSAFGSLGEGHIRISYAASYSQLEEAMDRIENAVKRIKLPS